VPLGKTLPELLTTAIVLDGLTEASKGTILAKK